MVNDLDYNGIKLPVSQKDYIRVEQKNNVFMYKCIYVFCYEDGLTYPIFCIRSKVFKLYRFICDNKQK